MRQVGWSHARRFHLDRRRRQRRFAGPDPGGRQAAGLVSHEPPVDQRSCRVCRTTPAGCADAVRHLVEHGHQRIAFAGMMAQPDVRERYRAYCDELRAHGIEPDPRLLYDAGRHAAHRWSSRPAAPCSPQGLPSTAVVAGTDLNALGRRRDADRRRPAAAVRPSRGRFRRYGGRRLLPTVAVDRGTGLHRPSAVRRGRAADRADPGPPGSPRGHHRVADPVRTSPVLRLRGRPTTCRLRAYATARNSTPALIIAPTVEALAALHAPGGFCLRAPPAMTTFAATLAIPGRAAPGRQYRGPAAQPRGGLLARSRRAQRPRPGGRSVACGSRTAGSTRRSPYPGGSAGTA